MIEIVLFVIFFAALVVGALIANALGKLPNAEELEIEDRERWARLKRDRGA